MDTSIDKSSCYEELVHKLKAQNDTFKKWERQLMNEPESEEKYARIDLMRKVIDRSNEVVNWWDNYEKKMLRKKEHQIEIVIAQEKKAKKEKFTKELEKIINPEPEVQQFNMRCRYYCQSGSQRYCSCGMDMIFCSKKCAYATNVVGSTKVFL